MFSKGTIASDHLAEKAIHQSNGGNYGFVSSGGAVLVYSKGSWWKYQHNIDYYKLIIILIIINEKKDRKWTARGDLSCQTGDLQ